MKKPVRSVAVVVLVALMALVVSGCGSLFQAAGSTQTTVSTDQLTERVNSLEATVNQLQTEIQTLMASTTAGTGAQLSVGGQATVTADALNVRADASTTAEVKGVLTQKSVVTVEQIKNGWAKVNYQNMLEGWVSTQYLKATNASGK